MTNFNNNYGYGNGYSYGSIYNPYGYNPYGYSQPNNNQAMPQQNNPNYQQPNQAVQPQQQPQLNQYAFVNGIEGAKSFQLQPNQSILLMDSDGPFCYMKTSNSVGQSTLRYFSLKEVNENDLKSTPQQAQVNNSEYVLKADFDALNNKVNNLLAKMEKPLKKENFKSTREDK